MLLPSQDLYCSITSLGQIIKDLNKIEKAVSGLYQEIQKPPQTIRVDFSQLAAHP